MQIKRKEDVNWLVNSLLHSSMEHINPLDLTANQFPGVVRPI